MPAARSSLSLPLSSFPPLSRGLLGLALILRDWEQRAQTRRALARLDDHLLRDVGLGGGDAWQEGQKPFWRA